MRALLRNNGLTLVLTGLFLVFMVGQTWTGWKDHNNDQREHGRSAVGLKEYLTTGHFIEATAENWESEFLQMGMYVVLTICLIQKGSAESKDSHGEEGVDSDPADWADDPEAPWPVRKGGLARWLYSHSLSIAFFGMFLVSFVFHAAGGVKAYNQEQGDHGRPAVTMAKYMGSSRFWFESFQNWQSEFLSLAAMVYLTVYLRERGSPESKPVATPHHMGTEEWETEQQEKGKLPTKERKKQKVKHPGEAAESRDRAREAERRAAKAKV